MTLKILTFIMLIAIDIDCDVQARIITLNGKIAYVSIKKAMGMHHNVVQYI